jgi:L,D-transpeptidase ErfK/SrfK
MIKRRFHRAGGRYVAAVLIGLLWWVAPAAGRIWKESEFANRPLFDYPLPTGNDSVVGAFTYYRLEHGDTLLDVGRWYGLSGTEISAANGHIDWWTPPVGREIVLPTEHILPDAPRTGIVMNIPEMRIYYFYPPSVATRRRGKLTKTAYSGSQARVVYTFPVGLGRFDWKTPVAAWRVTAKVVNPTWVVPEDIYEEHLERDGEAEHVIPGGEADNPLGHYKLDLSLPEYGIHGTDVPWGVGMNVSHGCIRLYPEDIERLFMKTPVGTVGRFVYQPIKFGWRGGALYVEVHDDLYAVYPGLWNHAVHEVQRLHLENYVDMGKLEKAVEAKSGLVTYVMPGADPDHAPAGLEAASLPPSPESGSVAAKTIDDTTPASAPADTGFTPAEPGDTGAASSGDEAVKAPDASANAPADTGTTPAEPGDTGAASSGDEAVKAPDASGSDTNSPEGDWEPLPPTVVHENSVE